jgi:hypothetical protein
MLGFSSMDVARTCNAERCGDRKTGSTARDLGMRASFLHPLPTFPTVFATWSAISTKSIASSYPSCVSHAPHAQFETIHPYLDGNGRLGRLLITLALVSFGIIDEPLLYLSLYLKEHRDVYYELLQRTRTHGEWIEWIRFFLEGVRETAKQATETAQSIVALFRKDRIAIEGLRSSPTLRRLHEELQRTPILSATRAADITGISHPTTMKGLETMQRLKLVRELTGRRRGRIFEYTAYLDLLRDGTEPLPA